jgi:hypothetical protein
MADTLSAIRHLPSAIRICHQRGATMPPTYVYAIIPTGSPLIFDEVSGVDDEHDEVYTVPHRDIAAVISASPLADYRGLKRDEAVRYLVPHQRVVEVVMQSFPALPVKFGTVLPD